MDEPVKRFGSTDVFLFLGRRGSGKSFFCRQVCQAYPRQVIFDTIGEYSYRDGILCRDFEHFGRKIVETRNDSAFKFIYQFRHETKNQLPEFNEAMRLLFHRRNLLVCVEEVQEFASAHHMGHWLKKCLLLGRHRGLALAFTTQRPGECHKTILSQANHVFCGSLHEKNDVDYCRAVLGDRALELAELPERKFLYFQPGLGVQLVGNQL